MASSQASSAAESSSSSLLESLQQDVVLVTSPDSSHRYRFLGVTSMKSILLTHLEGVLSTFTVISDETQKYLQYAFVEAITE